MKRKRSMYLHKYYFKILTHYLQEFYILFPVAESEKAVDAVRHSKLYANNHLKSLDLKILGECQYITEYHGTQKSDGFQDAQIKSSEYVFVPIEKKSE